jgi:Na+-transporting NADH:ubiquinone oxidoreductase subunit C
MALDVNKNSYTFIFSLVMVIVVAALLSFAATSLKPAQDENVRLEKMQSILASINVKVSRDEAGEAYKKYIKKEVVVNANSPVNGISAFEIELSKELDKSPQERNAPLYIAEKDGSSYYIIPLRGKGLWGPIWGYISLKEDVNTVYGATFDHKSETPGLGAEINTPVFMDQFQSKKILKDGNFSGIQVTKKEAVGDYQVDGISGGTITSVGVQDMIEDCMQSYVQYLKSESGAYQTAYKHTIDNNELNIATIQ